MQFICIFTAILSPIILFLTSKITFNFNTLLTISVFCSVVLSLAFIAEKIKHSGSINADNVIDRLNFNKKLIEYNVLLEKIIKASNLNACVEDTDGNRLFKSGIFEKTANLDLKNTDTIKINDTDYRINTQKIQTSSLTEELNLIILENITNEINEQKSKEASFAMIAHDLKTPVFAIFQALELLCRGRFGDLNPTQKEILELCRNSCTFAKYLVGNILCSYKINSSGIKLRTQEFNISKTIEECKNEISFLLQEKPLQINLNIPHDFSISCDKNEIQRVILNLLYNAITYAKPDSEIDIILNFDETYLNFSVRNESEYIPKEDISAIFQKNFSIENKYNKPGTGLGLYVSNKIIQAHGGEMIAKSSANNINIFGFRLKHNKIISAKTPQDRQ